MTVDAEGVALAAIQGLNAKPIAEQQAQIAALRRANDELRRLVELSVDVASRAGTATSR